MKSAGLALGVSVALLLGVPAALACNFEYDPVSTQQYYREQGWILPGVKDLHPAARAGARRGGLVAQDIPLDESQNVVEFPAQEFVVQGKRQRMRASQAQISVQRWVMRGRTIAYSYEMNPVTARRRGGKWVVESALMCDFWATFVDDKGDGVFRVLVPAPFREDLVPLWAKRREN